MKKDPEEGEARFYYQRGRFRPIMSYSRKPTERKLMVWEQKKGG